MRIKDNRIEELTIQVIILSKLKIYYLSFFLLLLKINTHKDLIQLPLQTDHEEMEKLREQVR
jgi:hypothetical protein